MRILVTGAAGFIGSQFARHMLNRSDVELVLGLDNMDPFYDPKYKEANLAPLFEDSRFRFYSIDLGHFNANLALKHFYPFDIAYHFAERPGVKRSFNDPKLYIRQNSHDTRLFMELCRENRIQNVVFGSTASVYKGSSEPLKETDPLNIDSPYGHSKKKAEEWVKLYSRNYGFRSVIVRLFHVYGPYQRPGMALARFARQLALGEKVTLYGDGDQVRDFTYIADVNHGLELICNFLTQGDKSPLTDGECRTYNLAKGKGRTILELIKCLEGVSGYKAGTEVAAVSLEKEKNTIGDIAKFAADFGYSPETTLEDGVELYWQWFRDYAESLREKVNS